MKRIVVALILAALASAAYAACRTYTITSGGRVVTCTECCYGAAGCTVQCW